MSATTVQPNGQGEDYTALGATADETIATKQYRGSIHLSWMYLLCPKGASGEVPSALH